VPVNADVQDIKVIRVDEPDNIVNPLGIKGVGEIVLTVLWIGFLAWLAVKSVLLVI
jgi:hypothetical protein